MTIDQADGYRPVALPPAPPASSPAARRVLQRNRRRDTAPELALRRRLHALGLRFLVDATPAGTSRRRRADVVLRGSRIAVLVHGCFWHRCPEHFHAPQANALWWELKSRRSRAATPTPFGSCTRPVGSPSSSGSTRTWPLWPARSPHSTGHDGPGSPTTSAAEPVGATSGGQCALPARRVVPPARRVPTWPRSAVVERAVHGAGHVVAHL